MPLNDCAIKLTTKNAEWMISSYLEDDNRITDFNCDVNVLQNLDVSGDLDVSNNAVFHKELVVWEQAYMKDNIIVDGSANIQGRLDVNGISVLNDELDVSKNTILRSELEVWELAHLKENLKVDGSTNLTGQLDVNGNAVLQQDLTVARHAKIEQNLDVLGNVDISGDLYVVGIIHGNRLITHVEETTESNELHITGKSKFDDDVDISGDVLVKGYVDISGGVECAYSGPKSCIIGNGLPYNTIDRKVWYKLENDGECVTIQNIGNQWSVIGRTPGAYGSMVANNVLNGEPINISNDDGGLTNESFAAYKYEETCDKSIFVIADPSAVFIVLPAADSLSTRQLTFKLSSDIPLYITTHEIDDNNYYLDGLSEISYHMHQDPIILL